MASFSPINAQIIALVAEQVKKQDPNAGLRPGETVQVTSSGPGQATAVAVPAPSYNLPPVPPSFVPSFQPVQARPAPTPVPSPTGQFIYNQYRRPAPPRMMFEGLPSLLERFRMQPSAQQQYPVPPRFRFAEGGPVVDDFFRFLNSRRML